PIDVPEVVARTPLAQRLEQATFAQLPNPLHPGFAPTLRVGDRRAQPHGNERRIHHDIPGQRQAHAMPPESQRSEAVYDEPARIGTLAAAPRGDDGDGFTSRPVWRNGQSARLLGAAEDV